MTQLYSHSNWPETALIKHIDAFDYLIQEKRSQNWSAVFLTVLFRPLAGGREAKITQMKTEIERIYSILTTQICRHPGSRSTTLPLLIGMPDLPVHKTTKISIRDAVVNDGLHYHCIALIPSGSRFANKMKYHYERWVSDNGRRGSRRVHDHHFILQHFKGKYDVYRNPTGIIDRIDVRPIATRSTSLVTPYLLKSIHRKLDYEHILILPKARSEKNDSIAKFQKARRS